MCADYFWLTSSPQIMNIITNNNTNTQSNLSTYNVPISAHTINVSDFWVVRTYPKSITKQKGIKFCGFISQSCQWFVISKSVSYHLFELQETVVFIIICST